MNRLGRNIAMLAGLAALATTPTISAARADVSPVCGQTITTNTTLTADLGPCSNNGLIIGASNITLDLGGHRIFGTPQKLDGAGVYMAGRTGVTVRNGTVTNFDAGVVIEGGSGNTVTGISAVRNIGGTTGGTQSRFGDGIAIESSSNNRIVGNQANDNGPFSGIGLYSLIDSDHPRATSGPSTGNLIDSNQVVGNVIGRDGFTASTDNDGIRLETNTPGNTITNNEVSGNGLDGIALFVGAADTVIRNNQVTNNGLFRSAARNGDGIMVGRLSDRSIIENNLLTGNGDNGIIVRNPAGTLPGASNVVIRFNTSVGNAVRPTIPSANFGQAYDLYDRNPNCDSNIWFGNTYRTFNPPCVTTGGRQA
jgi:parallel beta-helix repeat protein